MKGMAQPAENYWESAAVCNPLRGKVALVTGGAKRIGRAIVLELARAGAHVVFTYRHSAADAAETEREATAFGGDVHRINADVRHSEAVRQVIGETLERFGQLDVVVNNVGRYEDVRFEEITDRQWDEMMETNLRAPFLVSREAIPALRGQRGRIIHLGSVGGILPFPTHAHYCASKAGLAHLTRAMARALAPEIAVNAVAPGLIIFKPEPSPWEARMVEKTPLRRAGTPEDVASAVRFLATCDAALTGQILVVDGGLSLPGAHTDAGQAGTNS